MIKKDLKKELGKYLLNIPVVFLLKLQAGQIAFSFRWFLERKYLEQSYLKLCNLCNKGIYLELF